MTGSRPAKSKSAKMQFLIKRRQTTTREELIAHWFANHMPDVIAQNTAEAITGRPQASRYIATLFDPRPGNPHLWDGVAQLWFPEPLPRPKVAHGEIPKDTFQEKVEPYIPWATHEYVVMEGDLPLDPPTLNPPFPCTRSGFFKVTFLVCLKDGSNSSELFNHWLDVHIPNVRKTMEAVGGFRYVVSHSQEPAAEPYAGMAELYFPDVSSWTKYKDLIQPDGMERWVGEVLRFESGTEMVGIP